MISIRKVVKSILLSFLLIALLASTCLGNEAGSKEKSIIVCTTSILADFTREVGKEYIQVKEIVPAGMCPAHYDIKPSDIYTVSKATIIFSHGFEPWLQNLVESSGNKTTQIIRVKGPWNPPSLAVAKIEMINESLCNNIPEKAEYFNKSATDLIKTIHTNSKQIIEEASNLQVSKIKVICNEFQKDFVSWLGFNVIATYPSPEMISTKQFLKLLLKGKTENITLIIDNLQSGTEFGSKLAFDLGATQIVLSNFPGATPETDSYVKLIKYNATQLFNGIKVK
ncbi:metal ABC transporter substrate-binding protein [bacterium]|nr:metal ABC transporter substrate-binding protein [bacterium]MBU4509672.1 metal ABC transporter substrate-binding protein [bacterium]